MQKSPEQDGSQGNRGPLLTVRQFVSQYPWPSESALRAYILRAQELGIESAFVRFKRRVLVRPDTFFSLISQKDPHKGGHQDVSAP